MIPAHEIALRAMADDAGHIAAIAHMVATVLFLDPDTAIAAEATEGLTILARRLENRIVNLADPDAVETPEGGQ